MAAIRTQVYLTQEQRQRLDAHRRRTGMSLAEAIRVALDHYLADEEADPRGMLSATLGTIPDLAVPSRDEWNRG